MLHLPASAGGPATILPESFISDHSSACNDGIKFITLLLLMQGFPKSYHSTSLCGCHAELGTGSEYMWGLQIHRFHICRLGSKQVLAPPEPSRGSQCCRSSRQICGDFARFKKPSRGDQSAIPIPFRGTVVPKIEDLIIHHFQYS